MAKVTNPLFSGDVRGKFGKIGIYRKGGVVTRLFSPSNPRSIAQTNHRFAFKEYYMTTLTQAQADLLYMSILRTFDHSEFSGLLNDDHPQYLNQSRADERYLQKTIFSGLSTVEIDFGSAPTLSAEFSISNALASVGKNVIAFQSGEAATGRDADENEMDTITFCGRCFDGGIIFYAESLQGPVSGKFKVNYVFG